MPTTITVEDEQLERFKQLKAELDDVQANVPDHTNGSFLKCLMDTYEAAEEGHYGEPNDPITLSEVDEIAKQLELTQEVVVENVTIENDESSGIDADDVENMIESWMQRNADKLRKGQV